MTAPHVHSTDWLSPDVTETTEQRAGVCFGTKGESRNSVSSALVFLSHMPNLCLYASDVHVWTATDPLTWAPSSELQLMDKCFYSTIVLKSNFEVLVLYPSITICYNFKL